ncbi:unnamed protein product, partial [Timema podura]|nr:unnamed protein product [Timema podura]
EPTSQSPPESNVCKNTIKRHGAVYEIQAKHVRSSPMLNIDSEIGRIGNNQTLAACQTRNSEPTSLLNYDVERAAMCHAPTGRKGTTYNHVFNR